jgi:hypothetical protein
MIHGFLTMGGAIPAVQAALTRIADAFAVLAHEMLAGAFDGIR